MDPNTTLQTLRHALDVTEHLEHDCDSDCLSQLAVACEAFAALDGWLSKKGFLPTDWNNNERKG